MATQPPSSDLVGVEFPPMELSSRFGSLRPRLADQVWPGDRITTKQWLDGDGSAIVEAETDRGITVLNQAHATAR